MELVEIVRNRRPIGQASMSDDYLQDDLQLRRRRPRCHPCSHAHVVHAFAYRRSRDEHWPVCFCGDCLAILAGRDPYLKLTKRPRWKYDERNVAARTWMRQWPRAGRPRRGLPPPEVSWPDLASGSTATTADQPSDPDSLVVDAA